jgi:L-fucose isomerase-like protein
VNVTVSEPEIGVVTLALPGERLDLCEPLQAGLCEALSSAGFRTIVAPNLVLTAEDMATTLTDLRSHNVRAICYAIGTWVDPASVAAAIRGTQLPALLVSNTEPASFGFTGASAVHGALDRLDVEHEIFHGPMAGSGWDSVAVAYLRACVIRGQLAESKLGLIGGQSPGQITGNLELAEVLDIFGVATEQVDQLVIVETVKKMANNRIEEECRRLRSISGSIDASEQSLRQAVARSLAVADLATQMHFDITSIKCLSDAINVCGSFCVAVSALNSIESTVACQGDIPAIVLMECMRGLSGEPAFFGDLVSYEPGSGEGRVINCGACATALASRPDSVRWCEQYAYMGEAGGVTARFAIKPGIATLTSMTRTRSGLRLLATLTDVLDYPPELFEEIRDRWPQGRLALRGDPQALVHELRSNHVVLGYGDHIAPLRALARMWGVEAVVL